MKTKYKHREDLTDIQIKQLFSLALSFAQQFLDDQKESHTEVNEFIDFIKLNNNINTQDGAVEEVSNVHKILMEITKNEDVNANSLLIAVSSALYIYESGYWKGSKGLKSLRVSNCVYDKLEGLIGSEKQFRNTNELIGKLHKKFTEG